MKRITTGIPRLDKLVEGGYPEGAVVLVSGSPGAGKTIYAMQFLIDGARKGDKGLYISFEESVKNVKMQADEFGWNLDALERKNQLRVVSLMVAHSNITKVLDEIESLVRKFMPKRLVLDSLSTLGVFTEIETQVDHGKELLSNVFGEAIIRKAIITLVERLRAFDTITTIVTSELQEGSPWYSRDTVSEFACDGVVKLSKIDAAGKRLLTVVKMRATKHQFLPKTIEIGDKGIVILE
ncbi:Circadian clock protein kinase KaiC [Candidatus Burarchaeum australiense]|nr:Circadian clock protein kinase KaiC [Candidatus Burarchaeum australiense]